MPSYEDILQSVGPFTQAAMQQMVEQFMRQTSTQAWKNAQMLIAGDAEEVAQVVNQVIHARAAAVVDRFGQVKAGRLADMFATALDEGWTARQLAGEVGKLYDGLADHYLDGIARTELAFAHESSARTYWRQAGVERLQFNFGGGPCGTRVCVDAAGEEHIINEPIENIGYSFEGTDIPPLHPSCTCFLTPV